MKLKAMTYAVSVLILTPVGIPLLIDYKKPMPHFWKLVGGKNRTDEDSVCCAIRNVFLKTGIRLSSAELRVEHREQRGDHEFILFVARLPLTPKLAKPQNQEFVQYFPLSEILSMRNLFPVHRQFIRKFVNS